MRLLLPLLLLATSTAYADVTLYVDANYQGASVSLPEGRYDIDQLRIGNDRLSSVRVPQGWRIVLYEHAHYQGKSFTIDTDSSYLSSFNDITSSIIVTRLGPPTVPASRGRKCADEGGWCEFIGPANVYYGARDRWFVKEHGGRVQCTNAVFGDPLVGARKACFVEGDRPTVSASRGRKCADEAGWCELRGPATIYYGVRDRWVAKEQSGRVHCTNATFGDPYVGVGKACFADQRPDLINYRRGDKCADEGGWCEVAGPSTVYYGAGDKWTFKEVRGRLQCNNDTFGDPVVGTRKSCFVERRGR